MQLTGTHLPLHRKHQNAGMRRALMVLIFLGTIVLLLFQQGAVKPVSTIVPTATRNAVSFAEEGEALFSAGKLEQAIEAYHKAFVIDPTNVDYGVAEVRALIYDRQLVKALEQAQGLSVKVKNSVKVYAILAWALDQNGRYDEAKAAAVQALALDSNYAPAHAYYSEILNDVGNWNQGYEHAKVAVNLDPNSVDAYRALGWSNEVVGQYAAAIQYYQKALAINPNLISLYIRLGVNYRGLEPPDYDSAIAAFSKANAIDATDVDPLLYLSNTHYQKDELGVARQYLEQARELEPDNADIHGRLGFILFKLKNYEDAEPELMLAVFGGNYIVKDPEKETSLTYPVKGLELDDQTKKYYYTLGNLWAYQDKCSPSEAPAVLAMVLQRFPEDPTVLGSYEESMNICNALATGSTPEPAASPTP